VVVLIRQRIAVGKVLETVASQIIILLNDKKAII